MMTECDPSDSPYDPRYPIKNNRSRLPLQHDHSRNEDEDDDEETPPLSATSSSSSSHTNMTYYPSTSSSNTNTVHDLDATYHNNRTYQETNDNTNVIDETIGSRITPLIAIPYAHSGHAGAAPLMLKNKKWMLILQHLMPDVHQDLLSMLHHFNQIDDSSLTLGNTSSSSNNNSQNSSDTSAAASMESLRIMKWAENNPVVAAFGMIHSDNGRGNSHFRIRKRKQKHKSNILTQQIHHNPIFQHTANQHNNNNTFNYSSSHPPKQKRQSHSETHHIPTNPTKHAIEWDVFLDPTLVKTVDKAMSQVKHLQLAKKWSNNLMNVIDDETIIAAQVEVDRQVSRLLSRMMLAHGSTANLLVEAVGVARGYNFSSVVESQSRRRVNSASMSSSRGVGSSDRLLVKNGLISPCGLRCNRGRYEDTTVDDSFIELAHTASNSLDPEVDEMVTTQSIPQQQQSLVQTQITTQPSLSPDHHKQQKITTTSARTGGIFVEKWLALFASALKMNSMSEETILVKMRQAKMQEAVEMTQTHSFRKKSSRFLRKSLTGMFSSSTSKTTTQSSSLLDSNELDIFVEHNARDVFPKKEDTSSSICGFLFCLSNDSSKSSTYADHGNSTMAESVKLISEYLGEPFRVVLDLKSRRVPPRVWGRLIDNLRSRGLEVDGVGSFDFEELRMIQKSACTPVTAIRFFHSAGDLQRACHANEVNHGDTVYFNAGSLIWRRPTVCEATGLNLCSVPDPSIPYVYSEDFEEADNMKKAESKVTFLPYAYSKQELKDRYDLLDCRATIADYQKYFNLKIGLYVQEFSIEPEIMDVLVRFVNNHIDIYNLGLAWGGINGVAVKGIYGDGFWNQRYVGRSWDNAAAPTAHMKLLAPEDHYIWQKVIMAGACGQVSTVYWQPFEEDEDGLPLAKNGQCPMI